LAAQLVPTVERVSRYLAAIGTAACFDVWEENGGSVHTATLGCVYAGLVAASAMLSSETFRDRAEAVRADVLERARRLGRFEKSSDDNQVDAALLWLCEPFHLVDPWIRSFSRPWARCRATSISPEASVVIRQTPTSAVARGRSSRLPSAGIWRRPVS